MFSFLERIPFIKKYKLDKIKKDYENLYIEVSEAKYVEDFRKCKLKIEKFLNTWNTSTSVNHREIIMYHRKLIRVYNATLFRRKLILNTIANIQNETTTKVKKKEQSDNSH